MKVIRILNFIQNYNWVVFAMEIQSNAGTIFFFYYFKVFISRVVQKRKKTDFHKKCYVIKYNVF